MKERFFIISIGGDVGRTAAAVGTGVKTKKKRKAAEQGTDVKEDETLEVQEARKKVQDARKRLEEAEDELEAAEGRQEDLRNLNESDQGAIQDASGKAIETFR